MTSNPNSKQVCKEMRGRLSVLQQQLVQAGLPVIIVFEGFSAVGKGAAISSLILNFDPRGFDVHVTRPPENGEKRKPWMARFFEKTPANGRIAVFDRAWYSGLTQIQNSSERPGQWQPYLEDINTFERQMIDNGCLIIKFLLHISKKEQRKRLKKLQADPNTRWRVTARDLDDLKHYKKISAFYQEMLESTDCPGAQWHVVDARKRKHVRDTVYATVIRELEHALEQKRTLEQLPLPAPPQPFINVRFNLLPARRVQDAALDQVVDTDAYKSQLKELQAEMCELHNIIYRKQLPVLICFEGNDAAGKGGAIRRLAAALDPRGYTVNPIGAPTPNEQSHHYLWRFYEHLPKAGHIAIFDRTWYGRVLVERVEQLTPPLRISQAYNEINEFEEMLHDWGAIILKFWLAISKDEQLRRFEARENTPEKRWKITDEDWRNREKWDLYTAAVNDMLHYTNTDFAPWHIVESNNKQYARIKTLNMVIQAVHQKL